MRGFVLTVAFVLFAAVFGSTAEAHGGNVRVNLRGQSNHHNNSNNFRGNNAAPDIEVQVQRRGFLGRRSVTKTIIRN